MMNAHDKMAWLQERLEDASASLHAVAHSSYQSRSAARRRLLEEAAKYGRFVARYLKGRVR